MNGGARKTRNEKPVRKIKSEIDQMRMAEMMKV